MRAQPRSPEALPAGGRFDPPEGAGEGDAYGLRPRPTIPDEDVGGAPPGGGQDRRRAWAWLHAGLYALGAHLVSLLGQIFFIRVLLVDRIGQMDADALLADPAKLGPLLEALSVPDLLLIVVAGQGVAVVYTLILWRSLGRGGFKELGLPEGWVGGMGLAVGAVQGAALIAAVVGGGVAVGALSFAGWAPDADLTADGASSALTLSGLLLIAAFSEELLFRGYLFRIVLEGGSVFVALMATTLFFGGFHGYNPGAGPLAVVGTGLAGLLFALIVLKDGHLWRAIGMHFGWNFTMGFVASLPVSGLAIRGLAQWEVDAGRAELWLGGEFGPEAGLLGVGMLGVASIVTALGIRRDGVRHPPQRPPTLTIELPEEG